MQFRAQHLFVACLNVVSLQQHLHLFLKRLFIKLLRRQLHLQEVQVDQWLSSFLMLQLIFLQKRPFEGEFLEIPLCRCVRHCSALKSVDISESLGELFPVDLDQAGQDDLQRADEVGSCSSLSFGFENAAVLRQQGQIVLK